MHTMNDLINAEIQRREDLKKYIFSLVLSHCKIGKGHIRRGAIQEKVYHDLGFHGRSGNDFARFITKVLVENGIRNSWSKGKRVYYGLVWKYDDI